MSLALGPRKTICLVAHDNKKDDLTDWVVFNRHLLASHQLVATGTTGTMLERRLGVPIRKLRSGPLGGDQQVGALIADGEIDFLVFF
jgi:methylglyoxal synthase